MAAEDLGPALLKDLRGSPPIYFVESLRNGLWYGVGPSLPPDKEKEDADKKADADRGTAGRIVMKGGRPVRVGGLPKPRGPARPWYTLLSKWSWRSRRRGKRG